MHITRACVGKLQSGTFGREWVKGWLLRLCRRDKLVETCIKDGKLHSAPELVVEVLSPGAEDEGLDREVKLKLYSRRNVKEYGGVTWQDWFAIKSQPDRKCDRNTDNQ